MSSEKLLGKENWSATWVRHMEAYLAAPPRCGIWLRAKLRLGRKDRVLECAGGSCRDSRYLHYLGVSAIGSDFDEKTLQYLCARFPNDKFQVVKEDAYSLSFEARSYDVVFHNGFWPYFSENSEIQRLLVEQCRVAAKVAVAIVHNKSNKALVKRFTELAKSDALYNLRFFDGEELLQIVKSSGVRYKRVSIERFGGPVDRIYALERKFVALSPLVRWVVPRLYRFQPWSKVERVALVVELP